MRTASPPAPHRQLPESPPPPRPGSTGPWRRRGARSALRHGLIALATAGHRPEVLAAPPPLPPRSRVLLIRPDHLGDMVFAGPALARLARSRPGWRLDLLVGPWSRPVAAMLPGGAAVEAVPFPFFDRLPKPAPWVPYLRLARLASRLRRRHYDAAVILRDDDWWSAWLARRAGIPVRVGHGHPSVSGFLTHALASAPAHTAARNVALVSALCGDERPADPQGDPLDLAVPAPAATAARELLDHQPSKEPLVALHPGSGAAVKRWAPGGWAPLARTLAEWGADVLVTGGPGEEATAHAVAAAAGVPMTILAGRTDLPTLAAVYSACQLVIGPDSGPLHMAVAVGAATVHLFGPADPARFGPWGPAERHKVVASTLPCVPCGRLDWADAGTHPCVRVIPVAAALLAARACLEAFAGPSAPSYN